MENQNILSDACRIFKYTQNSNMYFQSNLKFTHLKDIKNKFLFIPDTLKGTTQNPTLANAGSV